MNETGTTAPILRTITVRCPVEHAFRVFTERLGAWWPLDSHSLAANDETVEATEAVLEPRPGGRVYEVRGDGSEREWGSILAWNPPRALTLSWNPTTDRSVPTQVEVRFTEEGDVTRVVLEHRGWQDLGDLGPRVRENYDSAGGWDLVLARYAGVAG